MIRLKPSHSFFLPVIFTALLISLYSCDKFEGDQEIPAYVSIDSLFVTTDFADEGTAAQFIPDVWLFADDQLIGGFERPVRVPVLMNGLVKLEIRPGIILNGIADTRAPYPHFKPIVYESVNLSPDSITLLPPLEVEYQQNVEFIWMESFEDASLAIEAASQSDTGIYRTEPSGNPEAFLDAHSNYSGVVTLDPDRPYMLIQSDDGNNSGFDLRQGNFIFLELQYRTDIDFLVGMFITDQSLVVKQRPYIGFNSTNEWKKVYVNFTPLVNEEVGAIDFRVYLEAVHSGATGQAKLYFDNIKLLSRRNL